MDPDVKIKPDPDDQSINMQSMDIMNRTNFKQALERERIMEAERKEQMKVSQHPQQTFVMKQQNTQHLQQNIQQQQPQQQRFFNNSNPVSFQTQRTVNNQNKGIKANLPAMSLPSSVLKVKKSYLLILHQW